MIIIGNKYIFNELEKNKLKKFNINIEYIKITDNLINLIESKLRKHSYKLIILNTNQTISNEIISYLTSLELQGIKFLTIEHFLEEYLGKVYIPKDGSNIDFLDQIKSYTKVQYFIKRIVDFTIAVPLTILTAPLMIYSIYKIKKESPDGPVIFKQTRIGKNKQPFTCYKFRSMRTDVDFFDHYTQENDPRLFPWGKFMRKTRIDELPQL